MLQTIFFIIIISFIFLVGFTMISALIMFAVYDIKHTIWLEKRGYKSLEDARHLVNSL